MSKLPDMCFSMLKSDNTLIVIKKGIMGYFPYNGYDGEPIPTTQDEVDERNNILEVTPAQRMAMENGSLFGWDKPIADPKLWEEKLANKKTV